MTSAVSEVGWALRTAQGRAAQGRRDEVLFNLAMCMRYFRDYDRAIGYLREAIEIDPDYEEAHDRLRDLTEARALLKYLGRSGSETSGGGAPPVSSPAAPPG